jgi:hypothetical protein
LIDAKTQLKKNSPNLFCFKEAMDFKKKWNIMLKMKTENW